MEEQKEKNEQRDYAKITPTAWGVAYRRSLTDIPFAKDLFEAFEAELKKEDKAVAAEDYSVKGIPEITPFFEARYLLLNELLKKEGATQIVELAAGLSGHSLEFAQDKNVTYVEMDLPGIIAEKETMVGEVLAKNHLEKPGNLFFSAGNALNAQDLQKATSHFDAKKEIGVINEGLLRYLSFDEKEILAKEIRSLLEKFGGAWITPDIGFRGRAVAAQKKDEQNRPTLASLTGVTDFEANLFADENHAKEFFGQFGFTIESHEFAEVKHQLVSPERLQIPDDKVEELLNWNTAFVMKLKA